MPLSQVPLPRNGNATRLDTISVWADPLSLAATKGVTVVFFSWGYLDVSIHPVPSHDPMYSDRSTTP